MITSEFTRAMLGQPVHISWSSYGNTRRVSTGILEKYIISKYQTTFMVKGPNGNTEPYSVIKGNPVFIEFPYEVDDKSNQKKASSPESGDKS